MNERSENETQSNDPLADELRSYRPAGVSPELGDAIAGRMVEPRRPAARWVVAALAIAASLLVTTILWRSMAPRPGQGPGLDGPPLAGPPPVPDEASMPDRPVVAAAQPPASMWSYRRAADQSMDELDLLLAVDAARLLPTVEPAGPLTIRQQNGI